MNFHAEFHMLLTNMVIISNNKVLVFGSKDPNDSKFGLCINKLEKNLSLQHMSYRQLSSIT